MHRFWKILTMPLLNAQKPKVIVEIGSQSGFNTKFLYQFCSGNNAILHTIDPEPKFEVSDIQKRNDKVLFMYKDLSLNILPLIHNIDVVLIDGDHNWYTMYHELKILANQAKQDRRPLPMVLFHDASWPYARRDLYYNPATIPVKFRHEYAKKGLIPDEKGTSDFGYNKHIYNALFEGGEKNGVLTAVEDFISESNENIYLRVIPAFHGYGVLISESRLEVCPELQRTFSRLLLSETLLPIIESLEKDRLKMLFKLAQKEAKIAQNEAEITLMKRYSKNNYFDELYRVYTSRSWRYTAPARKIGSFVRWILGFKHSSRFQKVLKGVYFMLPTLIRNTRLISNLKKRFKSRDLGS